MKRGDKVKYIGKGFLGFNKDKPHAIVESSSAGTPAGNMYILYGPVKVLVRKDEVELVTHKEVSRAGGKAKSSAKTNAVRENARKPRFSKANMLDYLENKIEWLRHEYAFTDHYWVTGKGEEVNRHYGQWIITGNLVRLIGNDEIGERFSKKSLLAFLYGWHGTIQKHHLFDSGNGCSQTRGKGEKANYSYGRFTAVVDIIASIEAGEIR